MLSVFTVSIVLGMSVCCLENSSGIVINPYANFDDQFLLGSEVNCPSGAELKEVEL